MKWNLFITLLGPSGRPIEAPNFKNPISCANIHSLLVKLSGELPEPGFGIKIVGLRIERIEDGE